MTGAGAPARRTTVPPPPCVAAALGVALLLAAAPRAAEAQRTTAVTAGGGAAPYDLVGVGTAWVAGAELTAPAGRLLLAEVGGRVLRYETPSRGHVTHLFPSAGLYLDAGGRDVRFYAGGGAGASLVTEGPGDVDATLHGAAGFRVRIRPRWLVRPELRVRSVDPWAGVTAELTLGVTYRLGWRPD